MGDWRAELVVAAKAHVTELTDETRVALCGALESYLRTCDVAGPARPYPKPAECDGVVLLEEVERGKPLSEFLGYCWLVSSQDVTPLRVRFHCEPELLKFEIRFGTSELCLPRDDLERVWRRGGFPKWRSEWSVVLHG